MGFQTRRIVLDANGAGTLIVPPSYFVGVRGSGVSASMSIAADGNSLGTAYLTDGTAKFVDGQIDVTGGNPSSETIFLFESK